MTTNATKDDESHGAKTRDHAHTPFTPNLEGHPANPTLIAPSCHLPTTASEPREAETTKTDPRFHLADSSIVPTKYPVYFYFNDCSRRATKREKTARWKSEQPPNKHPKLPALRCRRPSSTWRNPLPDSSWLPHPGSPVHTSHLPVAEDSPPGRQVEQ